MTHSDYFMPIKIISLLQVIQTYVDFWFHNEYTLIEEEIFLLHDKDDSYNVLTRVEDINLSIQ